MIISQTPYRVSFAGGGTDLPAFYREEPGAVLSTAITQHMYVTVHRRFEPNIRVAYSVIEMAGKREAIKHDLVRCALERCDLDEPIEITTIGDVPAGTGMGSSSTLAVGLLNVFEAYKGRIISAERLAQGACAIELDMLGKPIGRQDQYAAAYGGLNLIQFHPDDTVRVEPVPCRAAVLDELERHMLLLYTNKTRDADGILKKQSEGTADRRTVLTQMRDLAFAMRDSLTGGGSIEEFAALLDEGWQLKRSLGFGISSGDIDDRYDAAKAAGALGGKLLGAGGGGFTLFLAPPERHEAIREALGHPRELPLKMDRLGSRILFVNE